MIIINTLLFVCTDKGKVVPLETHQQAVMNWAHCYSLNCLDESRIELTIREKLYWKGMTNDIKHFG